MKVSEPPEVSFMGKAVGAAVQEITSQVWLVLRVSPLRWRNFFAREKHGSFWVYGFEPAASVDLNSAIKSSSRLMIRR